MDKNIYFQTQTDYGVYATRRYPKGRGVPTTPIGPTQPTDPNANPLTVSRGFRVGTVAPHALTERWNYTVPLRRRAQLQSANVLALRKVAAAPEGHVQVSVQVKRNGDLSGFILVAAEIRSNTIGNYAIQNHTGPFELFEGDTILLTTVDDSVGGSTELGGTVLLIEYDAIHPVTGSDFLSESGNLYPAGSPPSLFSLKYPSYGGSRSGEVVRSEAPLSPAQWISLGNNYYQRIV